MSKIVNIPFKNFVWRDISNPTEADIQELGESYKFHPLDLADCLSVSHRSKIDTYDDYTFLAFIFPTYVRETEEIEASEINVFLGKDYLITVHQGTLETFNDFFQRFKLSSELRGNYPGESPEKLLYEIINKLLVYTLPMIDHMNDECDHIERAIFKGKEKKMISEILQTRRNVTDFRKIMQVHKNVIKKLIYTLKHNEMYMMKKTDVYFESLLDYTKEIWDTLDNLKERIEALQQTNESQISFRLSDIMKILTIISVITFPITVLATIFGMNTVASMPFVDDPQGFWYVIGIMGGMIVIMLGFFKKQGWL